ncbi:molybdopterin binding oxidoreductase [Wolfiporia cocos MD-104 SS10]|uniref:Molybdopterin binding oxidoreductase n=1 Tax=Wolfiporia cocos (strain MD-104) TaxID=742152 RepID=A0A2H3JQQ4_WOLCO|nr:molybdopterin binding oxidoreductase [Wolfiporia cocos MD-104 SS10]
MDFSREPPHSDKLQVRKDHPWNAEPDVAALVEHPITPEELVYCRNHCPIEELNGDSFTVKFDGLVSNEQTWTVNELKATFARKEVVAALQCAGNRRKAMQDRTHKEVEGVLWQDGTIANCRWAGASMREILQRVGAPGETDPRMQRLHLCFASHAAPCDNDAWFGASIPLAKVLDEEEDVLLAYEMNGRTLSPDHGYPLRVVVPGYTGARWVKWVDRITIAERESENFYQQRDYKVLPTNVQSHDAADSEDWWSRVPAIQANPLNSTVASAKVVPPNVLHVKGYAVRGPSGQVREVQVSADEGKTWLPATITYQEGRWSWTLWEAYVGLEQMKNARQGKVWCRAVDVSGVVQEIDMDWNLRGVAYSAVDEKDVPQLLYSARY